MNRPTVALSLPDGSAAQVRPIEADDKPLLEAAFARLSPQSRRMRFLTAIDRLSRGQLAYLTDVDHLNHVALGLLIDGSPVAVGRMVSLGGQTAEVAITVLDDFQRRGIGTRLVEALAVIARTVDIECLQFEVLAENEPMLKILRRFGAELIPAHGLVRGMLDVAAVDQSNIPGAALLDLIWAARQRRSQDQRGSSSRAAELTQ